MRMVSLQSQNYLRIWTDNHWCDNNMKCWQTWESDDTNDRNSNMNSGPNNMNSGQFLLIDTRTDHTISRSKQTSAQVIIEKNNPILHIIIAIYWIRLLTSSQRQLPIILKNHLIRLLIWIQLIWISFFLHHNSLMSIIIPFCYHIHGYLFRVWDKLYFWWINFMAGSGN